MVRSSTNLLKEGKQAALQYPLLSPGEDGTLHAVWTTLKHGVYLYWDIHYMQSPDGGRTWRRMNAEFLTPPLIAAEDGPTDRITLDDEFECHTWLSNFMVKDGKSHFLYLAQNNPPRQHYVRYDLKTAKRDRDVQPEFKGGRLSLRGLDGFFASRAREPRSTIDSLSPLHPPHPQGNSEGGGREGGEGHTSLYCVGHDAGSNRLVCLVSHDNGDTWRDHAVSDVVVNPYAIGGCREVTADGWIIGSFTDSNAGRWRKGLFLSDTGGTQAIAVFIKAGSTTNGKVCSPG